MTAPRWEDVPEAGKAFVRLRLRDAHDEVGPMDSAYDLVRDAIDAALARLAEPAQSSAAERWRAVPEHIRAETVARLERHAAEWDAPRDHDAVDATHRAEARRALAALAREAEGGR